MVGHATDITARSSRGVLKVIVMSASCIGHLLRDGETANCYLVVTIDGDTQTTSVAWSQALPGWSEVCTTSTLVQISESDWG